MLNHHMVWIVCFIHFVQVPATTAMWFLRWATFWLPSCHRWCLPTGASTCFGSSLAPTVSASSAPCLCQRPRCGRAPRLGQTFGRFQNVVCSFHPIPCSYSTPFPFVTTMLSGVNVPNRIKGGWDFHRFGILLPMSTGDWSWSSFGSPKPTVIVTTFKLYRDHLPNSVS